MNNSNGFDCLDEIAIIGMAGRFPKAKNIDEFWQNLRSGVESISFFTDEELVSSGINLAELNQPNYVKAKATLEDIDLFDASFFDFSPREAEITDPQHRFFLECAWNALENAGYDSQTYEGRIGVYAGVGMNTYFLFNLYPNRELIEESVGRFRTLIGNDKDFLSTQVSYKLNLKGPSVNIQTACSTSLVAVHLACQSLLNGESDIALAGGVLINMPYKAGYSYQEGGILSPDGHCRAFDAKAQGTLTGNGVGIVVLKLLKNALADGDYIHAVIKASAINNDGSLKVGYTAPSIDGQAKVIAEALAMAGVEPETVSYIEAHGTGTALGDPIEIAALTKAFGTTDKKGFCAIGSVKTNIGHLDAAAGITGFIKTVLALKHKQIPPSLHFEVPNPKIDFANSPFYVNSTLSEWKTNGTPRRAGVSSFGIGGTNAHVVLEEAPTVESSSSSRRWQLLVLSAKTASALETVTTNLIEHFKQHPDLNLADVAYTQYVGRRAFDHRRIVVCQNLDDAVKVLETRDPQRIFTHFSESGERQVAFMFPGQGAQYVDMGRELYQTEPIFREQVDQCSHLLKFHLGLDLRTLLYPHEEQKQAAAQQLQQTYITQLALFVVEYALAQLWMAWGVHPCAMIGHSIGEYVAACLAGVFSLEDALVLVATRGRLMQQLPSGTMLAVALSEQEIQPLLSEKLSLAASNGPANCVVSGTTEAIDQLQNRLISEGVDYRRLHTSHAFHSQMMDSILEPFKEQVSKVILNSPKIPFVSNVTGNWITAVEATDPKYWARHLRQTVRFSEGIAELLQQSERILLEVGPGKTLSTLANKQACAQQVVLCSQKHPHNQQSDVAFLLNTLGRLWLEGINVDWSEFYAHEQRHRIPLPTYPFERKRYWIESSKISDGKLLQKNELQENLNSRKKHSTYINIEETGIPNPSFVKTPGELISMQNAQEDKSTLSNIVEPTMSQPLEIVSQQLDVLQKVMSQQLDLLRQASLPNKTLPSLKVIQSAPLHPEGRQVTRTSGNGSVSGTSQFTDFASALMNSESDEQPKIQKIDFTTSAVSQQIEQELGTVFSRQQQQHLNALIARFVKRTQESKRLTQVYRPYHANSRAIAGFVPSIKEMIYPIHGQRGEGAKLWDVDGNEYVDISMGFGSLLFGHSPSFVIEAIQQQIQQGILHGPQSRLCGHLAELICELTGHERAAFCNDGTEAVMGAIRLARAATGRSKIALFAGSYHGTSDEVLIKSIVRDGTQLCVPVSSGIPQHKIKEVMVLDYGTPESLDILKAHAHEVAAILVEPVQVSRPDWQPKMFLHELRALTKKTGIVLIFDEVVTGFRVHPGGIQALWDIQADLTTYGKAVGAGMPIGVVAGKATFMDALDGGMWNYGDASYPQVKTAPFAGTFFKHPLVMTAAWAALNYIKNSGFKLQEKLAQKTTQLAETLNHFFEHKQVPIRVVHFGSLFRFVPTTNLKLKTLFFYHLLEKGVYVWEGGAFYLSTAHTDEDIEYVIRAVKESVVEMQEGEFFPPSPISINDSWSMVNQTVGNTNTTYRNDIEQTIINIWQQVLGIEKVSIYENFFELGGDSVTSLQFIYLLNKKCNVKIAVESLYESPTINSLLKIICPEEDEMSAFEQSSSRGERRREKNRRQQ